MHEEHCLVEALIFFISCWLGLDLMKIVSSTILFRVLSLYLTINVVELKKVCDNMNFSSLTF